MERFWSVRGRLRAHPSRGKNEGQQITRQERVSTKALRKNWVNLVVFVDHNEAVGDSNPGANRARRWSANRVGSRQGLSAMPSLSAEDQQTVAELIGLRAPGHSLPGAFYSSDAVYRAEIAH